MENITYIGLSLQKALKVQMDTVANNIANMSTTGYKNQNVIFSEYMAGSGEGEKISEVLDLGTYRDTTQGPLKQTFNKLDMAIEGEGYFAVQTPEGERYTRAGNFVLNGQRELVTQQGYQVMGSGGPIVIPEGENQISVTEEGTISTENGEIGKIRVVSFKNDQSLTEVGGGLYEAGGGQSPADTTEAKVHQGMLESSNVQPIVEMNRMIEVLRTYQNVQKVLQADHDRQRSMISKLTQV